MVSALHPRLSGVDLIPKAIPIKCFVSHYSLSLVKVGRSIRQKKKRNETEKERKENRELVWLDKKTSF